MAEQIYHNNDGLPLRFGRSQGRRKNTVSGAGKLGVVRTAGETQTAELNVDLAGAARTLFPADRNNDGTMDGFEKGLDSYIPNGAIITGITVVTLVAPAGGTSYSLGTYQVDGTTISATALINAGTVATVPLSALAQDSYIAASTVGTYTAGKLKFIIHYVNPGASLKP
jgi:hypothetical protein